jgi:hypothetical protein
VHLRLSGCAEDVLRRHSGGHGSAYLVLACILLGGKREAAMPHNPRLVIIALAAAASCPAQVKGEEPALPRVRVSAPSLDPRPIVGRLIRVDADSLQIQTVERPGREPAATQTVTVPRAAVTGVEVSRRRSRKALGALVGTVAGGGTAALLLAGREAGIASCPPPPGWGLVGAGRPLPPCPSAATSGPSTGEALLAIPAGALLGWLVAPGERWEASDPVTLDVSLSPGSGRAVGFRLVLSF